MYLHSNLWIGEPSQITCRDIDLMRIDCTLKYQALLRSSKQEIKDVQKMDIDIRNSSSESGSQTEFVAILRSKSGDGQSPAFGDRKIKTYSRRNDPELEALNYRFNKLIENPQEKMIVSVRYNWLQPFLGSFYALTMLLAPMRVILGFIFILIEWVLQQLRAFFQSYHR
ncbi:MAG: hypothetical protein AB3A66_05040 [Nodularia sp. CChRGM 3473]